MHATVPSHLERTCKGNVSFKNENNMRDGFGKFVPFSYECIRFRITIEHEIAADN